MATEIILQAFLLALGCVLIAACIVALFRVRLRFGPALLYVTLGGFQYMQTILAMSVYVDLGSGILISPGSTVLFTGSLFAILLVHIRVGAREARVLLYGLVAANLVLSVFAALVGQIMKSPLTTNFLDLPAELFTNNLGAFVLGTAFLALDVILLIFIYEAVSRYLGRSLFLCIFLAMLIILSVDSIVFTVALFRDHPQFHGILQWGLLSKWVAAFLYSLALSAYLVRFERDDYPAARNFTALGDMYKLMTYRERYDLLRKAITKDSMTGIYNRGFYDVILPHELARAASSGRDTSLLLLDIDHFKRVNDKYGHKMGDKVIAALADTLRDTLRDEDLPCRYGGEEFVVILPDTDHKSATAIAERIRRHFAETAGKVLPIENELVTLSIGTAAFPEDARNPETLFSLADRRLYLGKLAGRNRVVSVGH